jgi:transposase
MNLNLDQDEITQLKAQHKKERDKRTCDRIKAVLLVNEGYTYKQVAHVLLADDSTVCRHIEDYLDSKKLTNNHKGSQSKLNSHQEVTLIEHLKANVFMDVKPIIEYVKNEYAVEYTKSGITHWLKCHRFTYKKPHPIPAKYNEAKQKTFIEQLNKLEQEDNPLYFLDATHPEHQSKLAFGWIYKGSDKAIRTTATQKRVNILGALSYPEKELIFTEAESINSQAVITLLEEIKFQHQAGQIINIVLDNATYQKSILIKDYIADNPNIRLHYLPAYSPNLNLIERIWKFMHKRVTNNRYYEHFENYRYQLLSFLRNIQEYKSDLDSLITFKFQKLNYSVADFAN